MTTKPLFEKVLVANRGEIAVRIIRALRTMGIPSVVVYHAADRDGRATIEADEAVEIFGEPPVSAYLDIDQIINVSLEKGTQAVHPGYGFLSENPAFARAVTKAGLTFIGPGADVIELMGDKISARNHLAAHNIPLSPSITFDGDVEAFVAAAQEIGFPILLKAAAGGGGKGMTIVRKPDDLGEQIAATSGQAARYFDDDRVYGERYIDRPRHIEVQILADKAGNCVHLWERECSIQRRFQKIIEESPAPGLDNDLRNTICDQAVSIAKAAGYVNAGTVEFILAPDGAFYFLEMNTRIQVEHPVTEMVTGIDLVIEQIKIAAGETLGFTQNDIVSSGHAIECRLYAEDADAGFLPATGQVLVLAEPTGPGLRVDSGLVAGQDITPAFDPMLAKIIAHGATRDLALSRISAALDELVCLGVTTNADFLGRVVDHPAFRAGTLHTHFIEQHGDSLVAPEPSSDELAVVLSAAALTSRRLADSNHTVREPYLSMGAWRN